MTEKGKDSECFQSVFSNVSGAKIIEEINKKMRKVVLEVVRREDKTGKQNACIQLCYIECNSTHLEYFAGKSEKPTNEQINKQTNK